MKYKSGLILAIILTLVIAGCVDHNTMSIETNDTALTPIMGTPGRNSESGNVNYSTIPIIDQQNPQFWNEHNASQIARIALGDNRAKQLLRGGGEIIGILVISHPTPKSYEKMAICPALRIRYNQTTVDFLVDEGNQSVVTIVIEPPSGSHIDSTVNETRVIRDGEVILALYSPESISYIRR